MTAGRLLPPTRAGRVVLVLCALAFAAERWAEAVHGAPAWAASHLDDALCLPLVLAVAAALHRVAGAPPGWTLPVGHGLAVLGFYSLLFEGILPLMSDRFVADGLDLAAYAAGWLLYHRLIDRPGPTCGAAGCGPARLP